GSLGALPELALVGAGEHGAVFLRLVAEDRLALAPDFAGAERHRHLDRLRLPFLPGAAVQPDLAIGEPRLVPETLECAVDRRQAHAVRAVGIGEIAGRINLVR